MDHSHLPHGNVGAMAFDRRLAGLLVVLAVVGTPALGLRLLCVGHACDEPATSSAEIPFCSLPGSVRRPLAAGFREGRSPDVLGVTSSVRVVGGTAFRPREPQPRWPSVQGPPHRVPLLIAGSGVDGEIAPGTELDDVAPTVAALLGIERPHPQVRSGKAIPGIGSHRPAPLVVQIVWKGVGSGELEADPQAWPGLADLAEGAAFTLEARSPSVPLDPAAVLATIGTGGTPAQHGITGTLVRTDAGRVVEAWSRKAPPSVIAALGDDLDELTDQRARVGLIAEDDTDRGLIGANWYVGDDADEVTGGVEPDQVARRVGLLLHPDYGGSFGDDAVPDLLALTLEAPIAEMDRVTERIVRTVQRSVRDAAVVVTATGSSIADADLSGRDVARRVDDQVGAAVVEAAIPGGLYLDQRVVADEEIPEDRVLSALADISDAAGAPVFSDTFPAIAVSFGRYC